MRFVDMHEDFGYSVSLGKDLINGNYQSDLTQLKNFDDVMIFSVVFPAMESIFGYSKMYFQSLINQVKIYYRLEKEGMVKIIRNKEDLNKKGIKFLISLEGTDVLNDPYDILLLKELNFKSLGLTWNYDTKFAASCMSKKDYGLTGEGEELVKLANDLGIIIDLAHASKQTVLDVTQITKKPVIVSHTAYRKMKDHPRNVDDEEIEAVIKTGGIIGVMAWYKVLPEKTFESYLKVINELGETFGWDHIGIGTDFLGIEETINGFESISQINKLKEYLGEKADKVLWENAYRVINENLKD
ncbi:Zn-dependent dipeptidase, microsomal dipeptidase [Caldisphaera lagunensis DSM 15908]|uniref:Zn-dependent dipeptidase, microsomal dipeptidase n=1 Tax=Caldisphaera lagunensis (strain DSM 15908 / JCM 11604 / ANMR 0165 / IC-154) TaxID=1056495 RepID=L0A883_CALLD|nr:membrane dipeptidase [Caldisphaera lagunensis]AFZ70078.1 Zn-dependent dipeptidase, microsomal dipeptidase [Caldisphaera lagunensis DSM 15908]